MKASHLIITLTFLCSACFLIKENSNDPTRTAITAMPTPVYEDVTTVISGTIWKELPPQTLVNVLRDSLTVSRKGYVEISWNDSTGYVPVGWLLLHGKPALLDGAINERVIVFSDPAMSIKADTLNEWQIVSIVESEDPSVIILYPNQDKPGIGYIPRDAISTDSLNFEFFKVYTSKGITEENFMNDARFISLISFQSIFSTPPMNENDTEGDNIDEPFVMEWRSNEGRYLSPEEYPGEFAAYYILTDSSQSNSSAFGTTMSNGYDENIKQISRIKLVFIPKQNVDFKFVITEQEFVGYDGATKPIPRQNEYKQVEPGKTYGYFLSEITNRWCNDVTFEVILSNGLSGRGVIKGECGD